MLGYRVRELQTGVYIYPCVDGERATVSVSGDHEVTLHCAGGLISDPFYFDDVVFAPLHSILYSRCVADGLRTQFGSVVQRPVPSSHDVPRRATIVHGHPQPHVEETFHQILLRAAEEVERIAGGHCAESRHECVFHVVCVYPSLEEEDLLQKVAGKQCEGSLPASGAPTAPMGSVWERRTSLPLRTAAQHQFFKKTLRVLCGGSRGEERHSTEACVRQVRLAVYAEAIDSPTRERILCAEHLFSLVPPIWEAGAGFGTAIETLSEVLMGRRLENSVDNSLLTILLPSVSVDCVSILTCVSSRGEYASRACIDACCFGSSRQRGRRVRTSSTPSRGSPGAVWRDEGVASTDARDAVLPLSQDVPISNPSQQLAGGLLSSAIQGTLGGLWTTSQPQKLMAAGPHTTLPGSLHRPSSDASSQSSACVDLLGAVPPFSKSHVRHATLFTDNSRPSWPTTEMKRTAPELSIGVGTDVVQVTRSIPAVLSANGTPNRGRLHLRCNEKEWRNTIKAANDLADTDNTVPREGDTADQEMVDKVLQWYQDSPHGEALVLASKNAPETRCAGLVDKGEQQHPLEDRLPRCGVELAHAALDCKGAEIYVESPAQRELRLCTYLQMLHAYVAYIDATCLLYTKSIEEKILLTDGVGCFSAGCVQDIGAPAPTTMQQQQPCPTELRGTPLPRETRQQQQQKQCDAAEGAVARHEQAAAEVEVKALGEFEGALGVVRRAEDERPGVVHELSRRSAQLPEDSDEVPPKQEQCEAVCVEQETLGKALVELHAAVDATREAGASEAAVHTAALGLEQRNLEASLEAVRRDLAAATAEYASLRATLERLRTELHITEAAVAEKARERGIVREDACLSTCGLDTLCDTAQVTQEILRCTAQEMQTQRVLEAAVGLKRAEQAHRSEIEMEAAAGVLLLLSDMQGCIAATVNRTVSDSVAVKVSLVEESVRQQAHRDAPVRGLEDLTAQREAAARNRRESSCGCSVSLGEMNIGTAKAVVEEEMQKVVEELNRATEELEEVEELMTEESDRAVMALRRCDGEMKLRFDRLMDRCVSFMDIESRLAMRSAAVSPDVSSRHSLTPQSTCQS